MKDDPLETAMDDISQRMASSQLSRKQKRNSQSHVIRKRSDRVEKPRSVQQSPTVRERRKTITGFRPHASLAEHYRRMFGSFDDARSISPPPTNKSTRPVSWHPSSTFMAATEFAQSLTACDPIDSDTVTYMNDLAQDRYHTLEETSVLSSEALDYSALSWSVADHHPPYQITNNEETWPSPLDSSFPSHSNLPVYSMAVNEASWCSSAYTDSSFQPVQQSLQTPLVSSPQVADLQMPGYSVATGELSGINDIAPMTRCASRELIGMGLYDPPGTNAYGLGDTVRRGLKLEESWQPPGELLEDDNASDADADSSEDEELPTHPGSHSGDGVFDMSGQSFFYTDNGHDSISNEWWYHQLKQPTARVTGYGYGWLGN